MATAASVNSASATAASSTSSDASVPGDMATASADATAASSTSVPGYVTTNSPQNVHKIGKQLAALGCTEISYTKPCYCYSRSPRVLTPG